MTAAFLSKLVSARFFLLIEEPGSSNVNKPMLEEYWKMLGQLTAFALWIPNVPDSVNISILSCHIVSLKLKTM